MVCIDALYFETDIVKWTETESTLHDNGIQGKGFDGGALDKKTVGDVLKIPKHLTSVGGVKPGDCPRETHVSVVGSGEAPLPEQVAGVAALLACRHEKQRQQKDVSIVSCHDN